MVNDGVPGLVMTFTLCDIEHDEHGDLFRGFTH